VAHTVSARKRIRQSEKRRLINKSEKSKMRTTIKKFKTAGAESAEGTEVLMRESVSSLYRAAGRGTIHKNQAARRASRMAKKLNAMKKA
jgi:small subunit ribosomal protein S20